MSDWPGVIRKMAEQDREKEKQEKEAIKEKPINLANRMKIIFSALDHGHEVELGTTKIIMSEDNEIGIKGTRTVNGQEEEFVLLFDYPLNTFIRDVMAMPVKDLYIMGANVTLQHLNAGPERFKEE